MQNLAAKLETIKMEILEQYWKKSFSDEKLINNYNAILDALEKEKSNNTLKDLIKMFYYVNHGCFLQTKIE